MSYEAFYTNTFSHFLGSITRLKDDNSLRILALRQLALAEHRPHSWFNYFNIFFLHSEEEIIV